MQTREYPVKHNPWLIIQITEDPKTRTKYVDILSRIHVTKQQRLPMSFSSDFTDQQIIDSPEVYKYLSGYQ